MSSEKSTLGPTVVTRKRPRLRVAQPDVVRRPGKNSPTTKDDNAPPTVPNQRRSAPPSGPPAPKLSPHAMSPERQRWKELTDGMSSIHGNPFDPVRRYHEGDVVLHKQFGMGVVETVSDDGLSLSALFRDGIESLELAPEED